MVIIIIIISNKSHFLISIVCQELDMLFHICFSQPSCEVTVMLILQMKEMKLGEFQ